MTQQYLMSGEKIDLIGGPATVGNTCSVVDLLIDWAGVENYSYGEIADIVINQWTYSIFWEEDTGRLFYDDERGH